MDRLFRYIIILYRSNQKSMMDGIVRRALAFEGVLVCRRSGRKRGRICLVFLQVYWTDVVLVYCLIEYPATVTVTVTVNVNVNVYVHCAGQDKFPHPAPTRVKIENK